ncbi:hypothetical protein U9M48_005230 [Paspalum notatum var. saurae]|uniref:Uncharacterized protein n=1 Tax=Paspalum notatum var. saurae TaxID=547442 RepID=A0AAQ3SLR4_PASNO
MAAASGSSGRIRAYVATKKVLGTQRRVATYPDPGKAGLTHNGGIRQGAAPHGVFPSHSHLASSESRGKPDRSGSAGSRDAEWIPTPSRGRQSGGVQPRR